MYCKKCGNQLKDGAKFCGNCGTPVKNNKYSEKNKEHNEANLSDINKGIFDDNKSNFGRKKIAFRIILIVVIVLGVFKISFYRNEPCDWCGNSPSVVYKTHDGSKAYVCGECRKECRWCNKRATKHYENYFGMIVFVCNDCYDNFTND